MPKKLKLGEKFCWELGDKQLTPLDVLVVEFELERHPGGDEAPLLSLYCNRVEAMSSLKLF